MKWRWVKTIFKSFI